MDSASTSPNISSPHLSSPNAAGRNLYHRANDCFRKAAHARWHRNQSKLHILRSQLGFNDAPTTRPKVCFGCIHYHGIAYGYSEKRSLLICGFHPVGWQGEVCPDWCGEG